MTSDDSDVTREQPVVGQTSDAEAPADTGAAPQGRELYRPDSEPTSVIDQTPGSEPTSVIDQTPGSEPTAVLELDQVAQHEEAERARARELAAQEEIERAAAAQRQREAERQAAQSERRQALGTVTPAQANVDVEPPAIDRLNTERFFPALGFFLLRLITAGVLGVHGYQHLSDIEAFTSFMTRFNIPSPSIMAWVVGIGEVLAAIALIFGILVRVVGICITALAASALSLVLWGARNPFQSGVPGFTGEVEVLLAAIGVLFALVGGGGWGIDGGVRRGRARRKAGII